MNRLISQYIMHSYLYYELDSPVIDDRTFDRLCIILLKNFDSLEHPHKYLVDKEMLGAGSGLGIKYTNLIKDSAILLYRFDMKHYCFSLLTKFGVL